MAENILEVHDLEIRYVTDEETVQAVNDITFSLERGESIGLVGETGAGKTTTALGIMGLVPDPPGEIVKGSILFEGEDLLKLSEKQMRRIRGGKISMIFQDPMTSLNPVTRVGDQIAEVILFAQQDLEGRGPEACYGDAGAGGYPRRPLRRLPPTSFPAA